MPSLSLRTPATAIFSPPLSPSRTVMFSDPVIEPTLTSRWWAVIFSGSISHTKLVPSGSAITAMAGILIVVVAGMLGTRSVLSQPPIRTLREGAA